MTPAYARITVALSAFLGGTGYLTVQSILQSISPLALAAFRFSIGGLALLLLAFWWQQKISLRVLRSAFIPGLALGLGLSMSIIGLQTSQSSVAAFLVCSDAFFIPIVDWIIFRRKVDRSVLTGLFVGIVGLGLLSYSGSVEISIGTWWLLGAAIVWAIYFSTLGHVASRHGSVALSCCCHIVAALFLLLFFSPWQTLSAGIGVKVWLLVLYVALVISALRFAFLVKVQTVIPSSELGLISLLEPVAAAILGVVWAKEVLQPSQWVGALLILSAVATPLILGLRRRKAYPPLP